MSDGQRTHVFSLQFAQNLFGFLFGLPLLLFDIDDGRGSHARSVSFTLVAPCVCDRVYMHGCETLRREFMSSHFSSSRPTSSFHHRLSRPLLKDGVRLDELAATSAPASFPAAPAPTSISIPPLSPRHTFDLWSVALETEIITKQSQKK